MTVSASNHREGKDSYMIDLADFMVEFQGQTESFYKTTVICDIHLLSHVST